jgi:hypothetical protein
MGSALNQNGPKTLKKRIFVLSYPTCDGLAGPGILVGFHPGHAIVRHLLGQVGVQLLLRHIVSLLKQDISHLIHVLPSARHSKEKV